MTVSDRFVLFMREIGKNQKEVSEEIHYPRTNLSNFVNGSVKSPKIDLIVALMTYYPELNIEWLLLGKGPMWNEGYKESENKPGEPATNADLIFLGKPVTNKLMQDLLDTKDELIDNLKKRIEHLEEELKRVKKE